MFSKSFSFRFLHCTAKMKTIITLFAVLTLAASRFIYRTPGNIVEEITRYGYPVTPYEVTTEDGYILSLFRIPYGVQNKDQDEERPAVLLMHGMFSDSEDFIMGGPTEGLAYVLADRGYDVFLGNFRGTVYGQKHTTLDPKKDAAFWRFCWNEMGVKDLPTIINKILEVTSQDKLIHIGYNEGATSFYVLMSEMPEYNNKIEKHISMGPIVFMKNANNPIIDTIVDNMSSKQWLIKNIGMNAFTPSQELTQNVQSECLGKKIEENICKNVYFLLNGYNSQNLNQTTVKMLLDRLPSSGSVREIFHYALLKSSGHFQKYAEDSSVVDYDLSKITVPVAVMYTPEDPWAYVDDIQTLVGKLQNAMEPIKFDQLTNNLDLLYSENVRTVVYEKVLDAMKTSSKRRPVVNSI